jgi:hypothetical protein
MEHCTPTSVSCLELAATTKRSMTLPSDRVGSLCAAAAGERKATNYKMTVRSKGKHSPETIKQLLKAKINPTEIKVGMNTFKTSTD